MIVLLVAGGPDVPSEATIARLAEESDLVIACDSGALHLIRAGILPDLLTGDLDSLAEAELTRLETSGVRVVRHPTEKDETDLDLGIAAALAAGADELVAVGIAGGSPDHYAAALGSLARADGVRRHLVGDGWDGDMLGPGESASIDGDRQFSLVAVLRATVDIAGAQWALDGGVLEPLDSLGVGNRALSQGAEASVRSGTVLLVRRG